MAGAKAGGMKRRHDENYTPDPGRYIGVRSKSSIPSNAVHIQLLRTTIVRGREVEYYRVWVREKPTPTPFQPDEEPRPAKVSAWSKFLKKLSSDEDKS
jgi:hypothetical protein